ncbi:iron ABC transporter substrate-binding protein [Halanaerobaculum tunisiense]
MKKSIVLILVVGLCLVGAGCVTEKIEQRETIKVTDLLGREVKVPKDVEEIVAVGPGTLRLVTHLQAVDKVVGVEEAEKRNDWGAAYNLAHSKLKELPTIGPRHGGDAELIVAQDPDLIFFYGAKGTANDLQQKTGIPVVGVKYIDVGPEREKYLYKSWQLIGKLVDKQDRAKDLIDYTESLIADLKQRTQDISTSDNKKVYAGGISYQGAQGIVSTKVPFPPFTFLDANYVANKLKYEQVNSIMVSQEKLLDWDPELIFVDEANLNLIKQDLENHLEYKSLTALKNNQVYGLLPYAFYHRNVATVLANSYYIGKILYPQQFDDIAAKQKANQIYNQFLGQPVYDALANKYGGFKRLNQLD